MTMPLVLLNRRRRSGGFNPATLFGLNEPGVWYDPSDLTTMFTDTAGTTPATVGTGVALLLDKSKGLVLGPESVVPASGPYVASPTGVSGAGAILQTIVNGSVRFTANSTSSNRMEIDLVCEVGKAYKFSAQFNSNFGIVGVSFIGTSDFGSFGAGNQLIERVFIATATNVKLRFYPRTSALGGQSVGDFLEFSFLSVRELPGFHATQSTPASRPTLARIPASGRRNLLVRTEEFDNAVWVKNRGSVAANVETAPDGSLTADRYTGDGTSGSKYVLSGAISAGVYTGSVYLKAGTNNFAQLFFIGDATSFVNFDISAGTVGTSGGTATGSIVSVGNGWYRCIAVNTSSATTGFGVAVTGSSSDSRIASNTLATSILIWGAQLETGSTVSAYQKVTSTFDVTEAGQPDLWHLSFDGIDDWLVTPTITPGVDKVQVFAGVRKLSDGADGMVFQHGDPTSLQNGSAFLFAPGSSAVTKYEFSSRGTVTRTPFTTSTAFNAPVSTVVSGIGDISGDVATLRLNGAQVSQNTGDQGTGNYLAYPLYIGRRNGTTAPFNGHIYSLITRFGPNLTSDTIGPTERWVANKTGVVIP